MRPVTGARRQWTRRRRLESPPQYGSACREPLRAMLCADRQIQGTARLGLRALCPRLMCAANSRPQKTGPRHACLWAQGSGAVRHRRQVFRGSSNPIPATARSREYPDCRHNSPVQTAPDHCLCRWRHGIRHRHPSPRQFQSGAWR